MCIRDRPNLSQEDLARISVPVWVTAGQRDVIRKEHTKRIAEAIPVSGLRIAQGESHSSYVPVSYTHLDVYKRQD